MPATLDLPLAARAAARELTSVLHLINGEHFSGAERVQDLLAGALPDHGYRVGFACLKPGRFAEARQNQSAPILNTPMRSRFDRRVARTIADAVDKEGYRLLHAHTPRSLLVARQVAGLTGLPLIYHVHSPAGRDSTRTWQNRLNLWVETRQLKRCARLVCVSQSLGRYMQQQGHPAEKLSVVPNGVPVQAWRERTPPTSIWTLGTVALFRPRKGMELLLAALALARRDALPVRLVAVGPFESDAYRDDILALADSLGVADLIEWTGFCREVTPWLEKMDAFILPSLFGEGMPMVVLEAMALGLPVIASDVEGIPEAVRHGQEGLLFRAGDPQELARQLEALIGGMFSWPAMRRAAWERQRRCFSDVSMAQQLAAIYDRMLAK